MTMRQILQNLKTGVTELADVPSPAAAPHQLLIQTTRSLISAGTERMLLEFGKASLLDKARQQPDKVRQVLDRIRVDGLMTTLDALQSKLDQSISLGYCNVGTVRAIGAGVEGYSIGDRVVSNGKHAEVVRVPRNLCARIPDVVSDDHAVFTILAAIGLHGIRLANPTLGECVVVTGLGLIGLLTVQMLRAQGCRVLGIDFDESRLALARQFGAETVDLSRGDDASAIADLFSRGRGVDAVIITAATASNDPMSQAARMCRKRGRIVLVGVAGLELSRADFYEKEISFQVSCSYGPGRYDAGYEEGGNDYPVGYVRWTEQRNFEAVLDLMASGTLNVSSLISNQYPFEQARSAYALLGSNAPSLGILLTYSGKERSTETVLKQTITLPKLAGEPSKACVGFLGAGNYAGRALMPAFKKAGARFRSVVTTGGINGLHYGRKFGFENVSTDLDAVFADETIDIIVIVTRHDTHARFILRALGAGKHVFVEKPLCLTIPELDQIDAMLKAHPSQHLMVGFNRRFAPQILKMKELLKSVAEPKYFVMTVNAGAVPKNHWTLDKSIGGGRIVGEGCHFVDLLRYLASARIVSQSGTGLRGGDSGSATSDKAILTLKFDDGSVGVIHYLSNGHKGFPKERLEVFCGGRVLQLSNFIKLRGWGWQGFSRMNLWKQNKGVRECAQAFVDAVRNGTESPVSAAELIEVSRVSIDLEHQFG